MSSTAQQAGQKAQQTAKQADPTQQSLSRLDFVKNYTEFAVNKGYDLAGSVYQTSRSFTPQFLEPRVQAVESKVSELSAAYGAPVLNTVQDKSSQVLGVVDKQVRRLPSASEAAGGPPRVPCPCDRNLLGSGSVRTRAATRQPPLPRLESRDRCARPGAGALHAADCCGLPCCAGGRACQEGREFLQQQRHLPGRRGEEPVRLPLEEPAALQGRPGRLPAAGEGRRFGPIPSLNLAQLLSELPCCRCRDAALLDTHLLQLSDPKGCAFLATAVNFLKKEGVSGATKHAVDSLLATVEQAKAVPSYLGEQANMLLQKVSIAWDKLAQMPAGACLFWRPSMLSCNSLKECLLASASLYSVSSDPLCCLPRNHQACS